MNLWYQLHEFKDDAKWRTELGARENISHTVATNPYSFGFWTKRLTNLADLHHLIFHVPPSLVIVNLSPLDYINHPCSHQNTSN